MSSKVDKKGSLQILIGLDRNQALEFLQKIGFSEGCIDEAVEQLIKMYNLFEKRDCTMFEINPFCETNDGHGMNEI